MKDIGKVLGENIQILRYARNISQEELAFKADINKSFLGKIERGESSPTIKTVEKIANALGIEIETLFSLSRLSGLNNTHIDKIMENVSSYKFYKKFNAIESINFELETRSPKQQEAAYKILKIFFSLIDKNY